VPPPPASPWDLEGLDWGAVERLFSGLPTSSGLSFLEFTLDTEDWYRIGDRLAQAAGMAEVPVLWRQDWRTASRYERAKRLKAPGPLAGLEGPWPDDDWPSEGEALWPAEGPSPATAPFFAQVLGLSREGDAVTLDVQLSRPGGLTVDWGKAVPLEHESVTDDKARIVHHIPLGRLAKGAWFLLKVKGDSARFGSCQLRTRWIRAPL
jgi:hypothetical protein